MFYIFLSFTLSPISDNESCISPQIVTFIIQKILADDDGLTYVCVIISQFFAVAPVLKMMLESLEMQRLPRVLKLIISCYCHLYVVIEELVDHVKFQSWKWFVGRVAKNPCLLYEWQWSPIDCFTR
jgi:hypothetical protein